MTAAVVVSDLFRFNYIEIPFKISAQNIKTDFQNTKCRPILGQFWPKMAYFEISQKIQNVIFRLCRPGFTQKMSKF